MKLFGRPNARGVSKEKLGAGAAIATALATILGWALAKWAGLDVPRDVLLAFGTVASTVILGLVQVRARNQRAKEDRPVRAAKLR